MILLFPFLELTSGLINSNSSLLLASNHVKADVNIAHLLKNATESEIDPDTAGGTDVPVIQLSNDLPEWAKTILECEFSMIKERFFGTSANFPQRKALLKIHVSTVFDQISSFFKKYGTSSGVELLSFLVFSCLKNRKGTE